MRTNKKADYERPSTVIGKDTIIETSILKSKSSVQINGILQGDADVEASIVVGQGGKVVGNIVASFVLVAGEIEGNVHAKEQLHVTKTALIKGDIICGSMIIDDGALLNGSCTMKSTTVSDTQPNAKKNDKKIK